MSKSTRSRSVVRLAPGMRFLAALTVLIVSSHLVAVSKSSAQTAAGSILEIRAIETTGLGVPNPAGLAYSPAASVLLAADSQAPAGANPVVTMITLAERVEGSSNITRSTAENFDLIAFSGVSNSLYLLDPSAQKLDQVLVGPDGRPAPDAPVTASFDITAYGLMSAQGMAFNPLDGRLFLLDSTAQQLVVVTPDENGSYEGGPASQSGRIERVGLSHLGANLLRGMAYNPTDTHLYLLDPDGQKLYEISDGGQLFSTLDISSIDLRDPRGMVFAPSGDLTDDPGILDLYMSDSGAGSNPRPGRIMEFALTSPNSVSPLALQQILAPSETTASLVNTIQASNWSPPAPDTSDVDFQPNGLMLVSDSEVNEMAIYRGANVFETTPGGNLIATCNTLDFSHEPSGVTVDPNNGHIFFSDDDKDQIFEVSLGNDGKYCTADDAVTFFSTLGFNSTDPEGVGFGAGKLFISDGLNKEIYIVDPGANRVFDGVPPNGDDQLSSFDTAVMGLDDPEDIDYHPGRGTLFIISRANRDILVEASTSGNLVNLFNIASVNIYKPAGLGVGPGSKNPDATDIYITDRGMDNDDTPDENDGKIFEISLVEANSAPTPTPTFTSTPSSTQATPQTPTPTVKPNSTPAPAPTSTGTNTSEEIILYLPMINNEE